MRTIAWEDLPAESQAIIDAIVANGDPVQLQDDDGSTWAIAYPVVETHSTQQIALTSDQA